MKKMVSILVSVHSIKWVRLYAKGRMQDALIEQINKNYTEEELKLTQHLLRFELSLRSRTIKQISKSIH